MPQVISMLTGELADCTICPLGEMADIDLFGSFTIELPNGVDLWNVYDKGPKAARVSRFKADAFKPNVEAMAAFYANQEASGSEQSYYPEPPDCGDDEVIDPSPARIILE